MEGRAGPSAGVDASRRPSVEVHPLVRDGRRRSAPFLAVEAEALGRSDAPGVAYQAEGSPRESEE